MDNERWIAMKCKRVGIWAVHVLEATVRVNACRITATVVAKCCAGELAVLRDRLLVNWALGK